MNLIITLIAVFAAFLWAGKIKKRTTQWTTVLLAFSSLIDFVPFFKGYQVGQYIFIFFSFFAGIESLNSLRLTIAHRILFLATPTIIAFFELIERLSVPYYIPKYPFVLIYFATIIYFWWSSRNKVSSRLGIIIIWAGLALKWLVLSF